MQASVARARLALVCTQLAMLCLLRCTGHHDSLTEAAARAVDSLQRPTMKFVQCFALTPLPLPGGRRWAPTFIISSVLKACNGLL